MVDTLPEILSYLNPNELFIHDGQFDYQGGRYRGKGWLRWNPETGARIDIAAERTGPPLPKTIAFGYTGWLKREHYTTIRMHIEGFDWVIAPHVGLVDRLDVAMRSSLSEDVRRLIWCRKQKPNVVRSGYCGHITLAFHERATLFSPVQQTTQVGNRQVMKRLSRSQGVFGKANTVEICGQLDDKHRARISWTASEGSVSRQQAWRFGYALRAAISLCTGCSAQVLERQLLRAGRTYRELQPYREPTRLCGLEWFTPVSGPTDDECLRLALVFSANETLLTMAWGAFSQLLDSQDQRTWGSSELLVAVILEGILRTLESTPFVAGRKYNLQGPLKRLRKACFPLITAKQCDKALAAHRMLRNHNAHPDWLDLKQHFTHKELTQSAQDMSYLSKFYGRIIFEAAGLSEAASRIHLD